MEQLFFTPPNRHLELTEYGTDNFYCLGQIYKKNEQYKEYALKAKEQGRFIILDSGVGDHGKPLTNWELFEVAKELQPNEVIPLDKLYNSKETINNVIFMYKWLSQEGLADKVNIFMCPQGDTYDEWMHCYKWALKDPRVKTIGWSKKTIPHIIFPDAGPDELIGESRNILYDILSIAGLIQKPIHLLGSGGIKEYYHYKDDKLIRSTDSCCPIWEGMNWKYLINKDYKRTPTPPDYFDKYIDSQDMFVAKQNMKAYYDACNIPTGKVFV